MVDYLIFGAIYFYTVSRLLKGQKKQPVVIGVPDVETREMIWLTKPEKTWWDDFKDGLPYAFWGMVSGCIVTLLLVAYLG